MTPHGRLDSLFPIFHMKAHATRFQKHTRPKWWPSVLTLVLFVLQPLLIGLHCGPASAHSHLEGQPAYHAHEEDAASTDDHHDAHHDKQNGNHHNGHVQRSNAPLLSATPDHQHGVCSSHSDTPMVLVSLPARSGTDENQSVSASYATTLVPSFRLDVLAGIHSRAGPPPDVPVRSQLRRSPFLGRAPPLSV